ncbi:protein of unknown function [Vibrio tapetis subsp. tapetis]|uniref:Uncharacterized protein n=1 Tax=Vibrio tapetis subsp. tapetis TaxID=1671868 RepID=A0A2N8ZAA7_9VIBR|nr:protein of unknown function [Vibrio tapetis subsp. tapetis]
MITINSEPIIARHTAQIHLQLNSRRHMGANSATITGHSVSACSQSHIRNKNTKNKVL